MYSKELAEMGVVVFRRQNESGGIKPHLLIRFKSVCGNVMTFAVDTTRSASPHLQPDAYLITHAHSDHYGKSAMLSEQAWCSAETAKALEIRYEKEYRGNTFDLGKSFSIGGVLVQTFPVFHTAGATAFYWENEIGTRILVTGDVKDASCLPPCDVLITEASYGDPEDFGCYFSDDIKGIEEAILSNIGKNSVAFGAYEFGKAQKAVSIIRELGYNGPISMNEKSLRLTEQFLKGAGKLVLLSESCEISRTEEKISTFETSENGIFIVPPHVLSEMEIRTQKYVLTCRTDYPFQNIRLSDHLDVNGLTQMVKALHPKITVVYHPNNSPRTKKFAKHLKKNGFSAMSLQEIKNIVGNEKQNNVPTKTAENSQSSQNQYAEIIEEMEIKSQAV
ncbi:MBL fold metallo-hydrolase [Methanolapillus millepedarum]|uniref:Metallo-beta-lactamase domain-containing protein n=1 Tax=Methanolapillus millepedarum TaxID=3028296 RepID=A0AA96V6D9_9EURY|nr:hypothetical protein MsAc7_15250 [Methanosarcinaceae archaeon Ac7]